MNGLEVGDPVIYVDPKGVDHNAIVTAVWSQTCINVVHVSSNSEKLDNYGRQVERQTSLSHKSVSGVHGQHWRGLDEEKAGYVPPEKV